MSEFQFKQAAKRKTWIFPLIIIILLYLTIPVLLINKGTNNFEKAVNELDYDLIKAASYYNAGVVFTDFATNFPGFSIWAKSVKEKNTVQLEHTFLDKCKELKNLTIEEQNKFCLNWKKFFKKIKRKQPECELFCK